MFKVSDEVGWNHWGETYRSGPEESGSGGEHFADAADQGALAVAEGEEFETVVQALPVADDGADLELAGAQGQGNFEGDDFAGLKIAGQSSADAVLPSSVERPQQERNSPP